MTVKVTTKMFFEMFNALEELPPASEARIPRNLKATLRTVSNDDWDLEFTINVGAERFLLRYDTTSTICYIIVAQNWTLSYQFEEPIFMIEPPSQEIFDRDRMLILLAQA